MTTSEIRLASEYRLASERQTRTVGDSSVIVDFQQIAESHVGTQPLPVARYLENSESIEIAVNGSSTAVDFDLTPASDEVIRVEVLTVIIDTGAAASLSAFAGGAALVNGLTLAVLDSEEATIVDLTGGQPIKTNNDLMALGAVEILDLGSDTTLKVIIRPGSPIRLKGADTEKLRLSVRDDLSGFALIRCFASGRLESSQV